MGYKPKDYSRYVGYKQKDGLLTVEKIIEPRQCGCTVKQYCKAKCECGRTVEKQLSLVIHGHVQSCGLCGYNHTAKKRNNDETAVIKQKYKCPFITETCVKSEALRLCCRECDKYSKCINHCLNTPKECGAKRRKRA